jgi:hypothetical protein
VQLPDSIKATLNQSSFINKAAIGHHLFFDNLKFKHTKPKPKGEMRMLVAKKLK